MAETTKTGPAPKAVTWGPKYSVGISVVDTEHQKLIGLLNDLHEAMAKGQGRTAVGKILDGVSAYTVTHFTNEEKLLRLHGYPDFAAHKAEHGKYIGKMKEMQAELREGNAMISLEVMAFLQDWLIKHIMGVDRKYTAHLQAAGVK